jgi:hypothetical protein
VLGVTYAIAGFHHGFFEALQGSRPTPGLFIQAIGPAQLFWPHGTEDAFTLIPNFLLTGITAMMVAVLLALWSLRLPRARAGPTVFLALCVLLTLVGGGIGFVAFYLPAWACATRLDRPLTWWRRVLSNRARRLLASTWRPALAAAVLLFLAGLEISVFGVVPGVRDPGTILAICWGGLLAAFLLQNVACIGGFAQDTTQPAAHS